MARWVVGAAILLGVTGAVLRGQEPVGPFVRFLEHMTQEQQRLPDLVCSQTMERFSRLSDAHPWNKVDVLQLEVGVVGDQELYGRAGAGRFFRQSLEQVVGRGFVSTGRFGLFARQILDISAAQYRYQGLRERDGKPAHEYDFEVSPEKSHYQLRSGTAESAVGYQGTFWVDAGSFDLLRLETQAFDIPRHLGLQEAKTTMIFARIPIEETRFLLPVSTTATLVTTDGLESLNRMKVTACRRYRAESTLRESGDSEPAAAPKSVAETVNLSGTVIELALDEPLLPQSAAPGSPFSARLVRDLRIGERIVAPQGTRVRGEVVEVEGRSMPFPSFQIGLQLNEIDAGGRTLLLTATMEDAGPAAGLIRQSKRIEPTFRARSGPRMNLLVKRVQDGAGFLEWDARRGPVPRGFKMKWRVLSADPR